jgi:hypothetical protein
VLPDLDIPGITAIPWAIPITEASAGPIFNYDKWEPGYSVARHIKISNEGSLALKYKLTITANGEVSELADVIDVYYVDPAGGEYSLENKMGYIKASTPFANIAKWFKDSNSNLIFKFPNPLSLSLVAIIKASLISFNVSG